MAVIDEKLSGDDSQDEYRLRQALPAVFTSMAGMSVPLNLFHPSRSHPTREETEQGGRLLLTDFVNQEIERNHVVFDEDDEQQMTPDLVYEHLEYSDSDVIPSRSSFVESHPLFRQAGRELSALADDFARSRERRSVRERADSLNLSNLTRETLRALMNELFHDGFTRERLVTLFFFCSDLIIKALHHTNAAGIRWEILKWVWEFFCERVCSWVRSHGGWEVVLGDYLPKAVMVTTGMAITAGIMFYIWRNW